MMNYEGRFMAGNLLKTKTCITCVDEFTSCSLKYFQQIYLESITFPSFSDYIFDLCTIGQSNRKNNMTFYFSCFWECEKTILP